MFLTAGRIKAASVDKITETQIGESIRSRCGRDVNGKPLNLNNGALSNVTMKMGILEAEDKDWSLQHDNLTALISAGYETIPSTRTPIAIKHTLGKLKSHKLEARMADIKTWQKNEKFDKKDFDVFMRELVVQSKQLQQERRLSSIGSAWENSSDEERIERV